MIIIIIKMRDANKLKMKNMNRLIMILKGIDLLKKVMKTSLNLSLWKIKSKVKQIISIKITWIEICNLNRILINCQMNSTDKTEVLIITDNIKFFKTTISDNKDIINMSKKKCQMLNNKTMNCQVKKQKWQRCKMMKGLIILEEKGNQ